MLGTQLALLSVIGFMAGDHFQQIKIQRLDGKARCGNMTFMHWIEHAAENTQA
jgi:hypothetical protein